ncbi:MAG: 2,3-bisphosphoglycerate-dependent phosphoglycerate mutase [Candidatus Anoxychlamydiales bacterium]|nr:2,3-bisphosphoglycerate-dependent phosphoglycerate mutase [Candidatus Anoxychlamydiales bacterium]
MNLYLMQHGLANTKEIEIEESLSEEGIKNVGISARALKKLNVSFDVIICSGKKRSIQTANIIAKEFNFNVEKIITSDFVNPMADPKDTINFINQYQRVFIAGHLPSIKNIISFLLNSNNIEIQIQNAGCTCIDTHNNSPILKWHLTHDILKKIIN